MDFKTFDELVERETKRMKDVMCSKSADYSADGDKLFNFKLAAELDGISPIEALRGMWLKHRTSLRQGLDELVDEKSCRSEKWWIEKLTDDRNYSMLLQALLMEKYFKLFVVLKEWEIKLIELTDSLGWYVRNNIECGYLHKDNRIHKMTTGWNNHRFGEAPGYWPTKKAAEDALRRYLEKESD
ncbi:hypothetical protein LCGC14_0598030 [marine sediment metagenome]|uniref:Uncharacterized protein n=1 Tax=marine sediment metagenome TaxID=412755 RepID=A0A0F9RG95_9ZZZZ